MRAFTYERPADMVDCWHGVTLPAIYEALAYALEHPDEMDAIRRANEEVQEQVLREAQEKIRNRLALP